MITRRAFVKTATIGLSAHYRPAACSAPTSESTSA